MPEENQNQELETASKKTEPKPPFLKITGIVVSIAFVTETGYILIKTYVPAIDAANNIVAPLIVAAVCGIAGWAFARLKAWQLVRTKVEAAPLVFVKELDKLIQEAEKAGPSEAIVNGRAIVSARNDMRSTLSAMAKPLNSEIDKLATDLGQPSGSVSASTSPAPVTASPNDQQVYDTIKVLAKKWPSKKKQYEVEVRKLIAELGLDFTTM